MKTNLSTAGFNFSKLFGRLCHSPKSEIRGQQAAGVRSVTLAAAKLCDEDSSYSPRPIKAWQSMQKHAGSLCSARAVMGTVILSSFLAAMNANTNGAPGLDFFTYTVNDGRGGTATGPIAVNVVAPGGQLANNLSAPEILGAGPDVRLTFLGIPADNYALDWTHDLNPVVIWSPLVTNAAAANRLVVYTNTSSAITPDFYRVRQVP
jgi:hypothetical protein